MKVETVRGAGTGDRGLAVPPELVEAVKARTTEGRAMERRTANVAARRYQPWMREHQPCLGSP
jgi:hypothetical protein